MIERALGETFPMTVATAVAFEKLREYKQVKQYNALYVNLRTLIRNAYGCIDDDKIMAEDLSEIVFDDIRKMGMIVNNYFDHLNLIIYDNTNKSINKLLPYSPLFEPKTDKQIEYHKVVEEVTKTIVDRFNGSIEIYDTTIKPKLGRDVGIILTSFCTELLSVRYFRHMVLLESHTGAIKGQLEWNTKLTNGNGLTNIPFCRFTVAVFGDNNRIIKALSKDYRKAVKELAIKGKWTANSSLTLVRATISNYADPHSKKQLIKLL